MRLQQRRKAGQQKFIRNSTTFGLGDVNRSHIRRFLNSLVSWSYTVSSKLKEKGVEGVAELIFTYRQRDQLSERRC